MFQSKRGRPRGAISGPGRGRGRGRIAAAGEKGHDSDEGTLFGAVKANKNIDVSSLGLEKLCAQFILRFDVSS